MDHTATLSRPLQGLRRTATQMKLRAVKLAHDNPRETIGLGVLAFAVAVAIGGAANSTPELPGKGINAPPAPPPLLLRKVAPDQALQINEEIPLDSGPNPAAAPFHFTGNAATRAQALECLASAVYYEAGSQDDDGERAVAQVVLNRVRHPAFPASVCGVVFEGSTRATGCQFTFTCDGSLFRRPDSEGWARARKIADAALSGYVYTPVGYATHYHANYVVPYWASTLSKNAVVGAHIFYRWAGSWGRPASFNDRYSGHEASAAGLRTAALAAEAELGNGSPSNEVAEVVADIPGAQALPLTPSMRGDKRVAIRFNLTARKASDDAVHEEYVKKFEASDNLKWSLSSDAVAADETPLGKTKKAPIAGVVAGAATAAPAASTAAATSAAATPSQP